MPNRTFTAAEKLAECEREIGMRRRVYPRFVAQKKLSQEQATERLAIMETIAADYREAAKGERLL